MHAYWQRACWRERSSPATKGRVENLSQIMKIQGRLSTGHVYGCALLIDTKECRHRAKEQFRREAIEIPLKYISVMHGTSRAWRRDWEIRK